MSPNWAFARTNSAGKVKVHATGQSNPESNQELFVLPEGSRRLEDCHATVFFHHESTRARDDAAPSTSLRYSEVLNEGSMVRKTGGASAKFWWFGEMPDPIPAAGEVTHSRRCVRHQTRVIPRSATTPLASAWRIPRVIPHSDGAGRIDQLGPGIPSEWIGRFRVVLRSPIVSSVWYGRGVYGWLPPRIRLLPFQKKCRWNKAPVLAYPYHGTLSRRSCRRPCKWTHCAGARSGRFRGYLPPFSWPVARERE